VSSLAIQQQALLEALWAPRHADAVRGAEGAIASGRLAERGLKAYRSNASALATRTLESTYPVVAQLIGNEAFSAVAQGLWKKFPPLRGDLGTWGRALPAHLVSLEQLSSEPYLPDVARVEWALHEISTAADAQAQLETLQLLGTADPGELTLLLCPGAFALRSAYPVASIVNAHLTGEPSLAQAGQLLSEGAAEAALVWRRGLRPQMRLATAGEAALVASLLGGGSLAEALDAAGDFDFSAWLAPAVQAGLLAGAARISNGEKQ
jgi:hypothetical protein